MLEQFRKMFKMNVRGFEWIGPLNYPYENHFVQFRGIQGDVYVQGIGLMTNQEYYTKLLNQGYGLYYKGTMVFKEGYSQHFNVLHKEYLKRLKMEQGMKKEDGYPVVERNQRMIFQSSVELYRQGLLNVEQFKERVARYIQPDAQTRVFEEITNKAG